MGRWEYRWGDENIDGEIGIQMEKWEYKWGDENIDGEMGIQMEKWENRWISRWVDGNRVGKSQESWNRLEIQMDEVKMGMSMEGQTERNSNRNLC